MLIKFKRIDNIIIYKSSNSRKIQCLLPTFDNICKAEFTTNNLKTKSYNPNLNYINKN